MIYFLYHGGYETGENLGAALKEELGSRIKVLKGLRKMTKPHSRDTLIRWGTTAYREKDELFGNVWNSASSILRNTNKLRTFDHFRDADLDVPKIFRNKRDIDTFPVLGRSIHHHGGMDIVKINGSRFLDRNDFSRIPNKDFYVEFIPSREEYRVHVFRGEIVRVTRKVFRGVNRDGETVRENEIKNDVNGWGHQNVAVENLREEYGEAAVKAVEAIGLDFGAVDLLISRNRTPYPLEVNSCPRLNSVGIEKYVRIITGNLEEETAPARPRRSGRYFWED